MICNGKDKDKRGQKQTRPHFAGTRGSEAQPDEGLRVGADAARLDDLLDRLVEGPVVERRFAQVVVGAQRKLHEAHRKGPRHGHAGVVALVAHSVELSEEGFEVLLVDEVAQGHDRGETHFVLVFRPEIGLDEPPHGLALRRAQPPAEAVAHGPVVDHRQELGRAAELLLGRTGRIADDQAAKQALLEIAGLGVFGQKCAPVAPCRVAGDAPQAGNADAEDVFHARHQGQDEVEIGGLGHFEQLFAQGHNGGCSCRESSRRVGASRSESRQI